MNKIKQVILFVSESESPWYAFKTLVYCTLHFPALVFHEIMHLVVLFYAMLCGMASNFQITKMCIFEITKVEDHKNINTQLSISYKSNFVWGRAITLAPLIGYFLLIIYCIVFVHPFILIYCVYATKTFMLSNVDIEALESLDYNSKRLRLIKRFKNFLND